MTARGLTEGQYEQLRKDPVFLFREALVSEAAFLKYTQEAERLEEAQGDFSMSMDALDQFVQVRPHAHGWLGVALLPITAADVVRSQDIPGRPSSSLKMRAGQELEEGEKAALTNAVAVRMAVAETEEAAVACRPRGRQKR